MNPRVLPLLCEVCELVTGGLALLHSLMSQTRPPLSRLPYASDQIGWVGFKNKSWTHLQSRSDAPHRSCQWQVTSWSLDNLPLQATAAVCVTMSDAKLAPFVL